MRSCILLTFCLLLCGNSVWSQELSLKKALELALESNPELLEAQGSIEASTGKQQQAKSFRNPELELEYETAEQLKAIGVSQVIELGGKRSYRSEIARLEKNLSQVNYEIQTLDLVKSVSQSFASLWAVSQQLQLIKQLEELSKEVSDTVSERVRAGKDSPTIQTQARIDWLNVKLQLRQIKVAFEKSKVALVMLWGSNSVPFETLESLDQYLKHPPHYSTLESALKQSPHLKQFQIEEQIGQAILALEKSQNTPDITVNLGVQQGKDETGGVLGISMPLNFFDRNQGGVAEGLVGVRILKQKREAFEQQVQLQLKQAYEAFRNSFEEATLLKDDLLPAAQTVFEATKEGYQAGKFDYLEMLHAQKTYVEVQQNYLNAIEHFIHSKAEVERLIGSSLNKIKE